MRIDLPTCGFKSCRYCFDSNCTNRVEYNMCEYREYKDSLQSHGNWIEYQIPQIICCSNCDWATDVSEKNFQYCPNCGAKMYGDDNTEGVRINSV